MGNEWWSCHTHTKYSQLDGMGDVQNAVAKAARLGQPAIAITDHGNMAGTVELYKSAKQHDIKPFPGVELYLIDPEFYGDLNDKKEAKNLKRFHIGAMALDLKGYQALTRFVSATHTRPNFNRYPRALFSDFLLLGKQYGEHIAITTGCFFGYVQQTLLHEGYDKAKRVVKAIASAFPHTFVELQNHNIEHEEDDTIAVVHDEDIVADLYKIAFELGLPVVATQDSHYCDHSEKKAHALMKRMVYGGQEDEFPGDSFHVASGPYMSDYYTTEQWDSVLEGMGELLDLNTLKIPPLDTYKVHIPKIKDDAQGYITDVCKKALHKYLRSLGITKGSKKSKKYWARLKEELSVIGDLGMASYFVLESICVDWCRAQKIAVEARGSANGSLVCFLMKITQIDPIKWKTLFERFMSRDRIKPPDIDMDIEDAERQRFLDWLAAHFDTLQIGTWAALGARDDGRGSVMVTYISYLRRRAIEECDGNEHDGRIRYAKKYGWIQDLEDVREFSRRDYKSLMALSQMSVFRSYGTHAAAVLISGEGMDIADWIPSMLVASSDTTVSQLDGDNVEEMGLLKMDWLGQATLRTMKLCQQMIGREDPIDFQWIPEDDYDALAMLREGRTDNGIFHFEGYTKALGGKEMGIREIEDVVLAQALYMPGCMDVAPGQTISQKDLYLKRRKSKKEQAKITYLGPAFEKALSSTYGAVVFQEQVINIMRELGMGIEGINKFFKVVKDSGKGAVERNRGRMAEVRKEFDGLCEKAGIDPDAAWNSTAAFVSYGFNRAHAAGYGLRSYRCAYLKAHYPLEFMTALLQTWAGRDKEKVYAKEARRIGIKILPPNVNISGASWSIDRGRHSIRRGLVTISGVGDKAAVELQANQPYVSILDLANRVSGRSITGVKDFRDSGTLKGTLLHLDNAGAFEDLPSGWKAKPKLDKSLGKEVKRPEPKAGTPIKRKKAKRAA